MLIEIKQAVEEAMLSSFDQNGELFDSTLYALSTGGKRVRPILVHLMNKALKNDLPVMDVALATEFFHTASLIVDDLPCMDNDALRRGKPTLHTVFGETKALLTSYGLLCEGFGRIEENGAKMAEARPPFCDRADRAVSIGLECAARCSGFRGAVLGQYRDLFAKRFSPQEVESIIELKTVTLFEGAFILGWIFGGGSFAALRLVRKLSYHFGIAFQIRDDLEDLVQDSKREKQANFALHFGEEKARLRLQQEVGLFWSICDRLGLDRFIFQPLLELLEKEEHLHSFLDTSSR